MVGVDVGVLFEGEQGWRKLMGVQLAQKYCEGLMKNGHGDNHSDCGGGGSEQLADM